MKKTKHILISLLLLALFGIAAIQIYNNYSINKVLNFFENQEIIDSVAIKNLQEENQIIVTDRKWIDVMFERLYTSSTISRRYNSEIEQQIVRPFLTIVFYSDNQEMMEFELFEVEAPVEISGLSGDLSSSINGVTCVCKSKGSYWKLASTEIYIPFTEEFEEVAIPAEFKRNDDYGRTFDALSYKSKHLTVNVLDDLFETDEVEPVLDIIRDDYSRIGFFGNKKLPVELYMLEATVDDEMVVTGNRVFCTIEDVKSGAYRTALLQVMLKIDTYWRLVGLNHYIFSCTDIDSKPVIEYLENPENAELAMLSGVRFNENFNSSEAINMATLSASLLTEYIMEKHDFDTMSRESLTEIKQEWLNELGLEIVISNEDAQILNSYQYTSNEEIPLIAINKGVRYELGKIQGELVTAADVEVFICKSDTARRWIKSYVREHATAVVTKLSDPERVTYIVNQDVYINRASRDKVYLNRLKTHTHEAVHLYINGNKSKKWATEGIAEYLGNVVVPSSISYPQYGFQGIFLDRADWYSEDNMSQEYLYYEDVYQSYISSGGSVEDFDMRLLYDLIAYKSMTDQLWGSDFARMKFYEQANIKEEDRKYGDELTYYQAGSFTAYLVDSFTLSQFLEFYYGAEGFEYYFGESYEEMKDKWYLNLKQVYGDIIVSSSEETGETSASLDELFFRYFDKDRGTLTDEEFADELFRQYLSKDFKDFVEECSKYTNPVQNIFSSYLIYGIAKNDGDLEDLRRKINEISGGKVYSYFTERLLADVSLENLEILKLDDDSFSNPSYKIIEADIAAAGSLDELVRVSFKYVIDGAYAEGYSARTKELYDLMELERFIDECCEYGEVIQNDFAMHLVYALSYSEEDLSAFDQELKNIEKDKENEFFIKRLEQYLNNW